LFAYGPADATAIPKPHNLLPHLHPDCCTFLVPAYPGCPRKVAVKRSQSGKGKVKVNGVQLLAASLTATGTHMPYEIARCYLPPDRAGIPALTQYRDPGGKQDLVQYYRYPRYSMDR